MKKSSTKRRGFKTMTFTHDEVPNDDLIAAMKAGEEYLKSGKVQWYTDIDEFMKSLR